MPHICTSIGCLKKRWTTIVRTKIFLCDIAHFSVYPTSKKKQKCRNWDSAVPQIIDEKPLSLKKFELTSSKTVTTVRPSLGLHLKNMTGAVRGFKKMGPLATQHQCIKLNWGENFSFPVISRLADVHWPPRSCDLKPLIFLRGAMPKTVLMLTNR